MGNTGSPSCIQALNIGKGVFFVPTYDSTGVRNFIDVTDTLDDAYFAALISNADKTKRFYPLQKAKALTTARAEDVVQTAPSGERRKLKDGIRDFSFQIWEGGAPLKKQLDSGACTDMSFYIFNNGQLIGMDLTGEGEKLHPIRIAKDSLSIPYGFTTDGEGETVTISFQFDQDEYDGNLSFVTPDDDVVFTEYKGLIDIYSKVTAITTTGFTVELFSKHNALNNRNKDKGKEIGDFVLYNITNSTAITVTSVTETENGKYVFVIPTSASKTLRLTPSGTGRDYAKVIANTFVTPAS
jgi:hypothetical protein